MRPDRGFRHMPLACRSLVRLSASWRFSGRRLRLPDLHFFEQGINQHSKISRKGTLNQGQESSELIKVAENSVESLHQDRECDDHHENEWKYERYGSICFCDGGACVLGCGAFLHKISNNSSRVSAKHRQNDPDQCPKLIEVKSLQEVERDDSDENRKVCANHRNAYRVSQARLSHLWLIAVMNALSFTARLLVKSFSALAYFGSIPVVNWLSAG